MLIERIAIEVPEKMRMMAKKRGCTICPEASRAVNNFNANVPPDRKIDVINTKSLRFKRYGRLFQYFLDRDSIPTPTIIFDNHLITYERGGCEWQELYYLLKSLDKYSNMDMSQMDVKEREGGFFNSLKERLRG